MIPYWLRRKRTWPKHDLAEIRKRARLLVVDDSDFPYQELFKRDGYSLEKWDDVQDLVKLESGEYDLILLDIQGVGREQSKDEGLGVLRHLKKVCPAQIVIAYSTADFSLRFKEFFDLADDVLEKNEDYVNFKRSVDRLLGKRFALGFYLDRIAKIASPHMPDTERVRKAAEKSILAADPRILERELARGGVSKDVVSTLLQVAQVAISIASL